MERKHLTRSPQSPYLLFLAGFNRIRIYQPLYGKNYKTRTIRRFTPH